MEGLKEQILGWNTGTIPVRMQSWPPGELLPLRLPPKWGWSRDAAAAFTSTKEKPPEAAIQGLGSQVKTPGAGE